MAKVIITADWHYGVPGRLDDIDFASNVVLEYCKRTKTELGIILGDLFHDRRYIEIDVLNKAVNFFEKSLEQGTKWIVFPGNHDMFLRNSWDLNSLGPLRKYLTVIPTVKLLEIEGRRFWILPFVTYEKAYMRILGKINNKAEVGDKLLTHIGVRNATLNTCFLLKNWSFVDFDHTKFDKIYTGHFHSKQQIEDRIWYPGSLIPFKFDEGDVPHGFYVYDTDEDKHQFIDIWRAAAKLIPGSTPPPQFTTIHDTDLKDLTESEVGNNIVRVALSNDVSDDSKRQIKNRIIEMGARSVRWLNTKEKPKEHIITTHINSGDIFKSWYENDKNAKNLRWDILKNLHNEIVQESDELYSVENSE